MKSTTVILSLALLALTASVASARHGKHDDTSSATQTAEQLKAHGWLGVELGRSATSPNVTINKILPGSPAETAGFQVGDVITGANGVVYARALPNELERLDASLKPGVAVTYAVLRAGAPKEIKATLGTIPDALVAKWLGTAPTQSVTSSK